MGKSCSNFCPDHVRFHTMGGISTGVCVVKGDVSVVREGVCVVREGISVVKEGVCVVP